MSLHRTVSRARLLSASFAALGVLGTLPSPARAGVPPVDDHGRAADITCNVTPTAKVKAAHADKIIFKLTGPMVAASAADQPALDAVPRDRPLDIKVLDDPSTVADLKGKVLTFLGAALVPANYNAVDIGDVEYAMVCPVKNAP